MNIYEKIVKRFPRGIVYSFAYGSGVKQQIGYENVTKQKSNIIDLTFCVENAYDWHEQNLEKHSCHYSGMRFLGSQFIAAYQDTLAARAYFNTLVPLTDLGVTIKYGVISKDYLKKDLNDWKYLYFAGRLHKPVTDLISPADEELQSALRQNLESALTVGLLMLPERFSNFELFQTISNLSYKGDFRMIFGEDKNKVKNIVEAQLDEFFKLYLPALQRLSQYVAVESDKSTNKMFFEQDKCPKAIEYHLNALPANLKKRIRGNSLSKGSYLELAEDLATGGRLQDLVSMSVNDIVWGSSICQSIKNIPTAGLTKSLVYSYRKALKTFK